MQKRISMDSRSQHDVRVFSIVHNWTLFQNQPVFCDLNRTTRLINFTLSQIVFQFAWEEDNAG